MIDDLKKGYYLLFIDGGKRANEQGQAEGAIGVILQEPDCGAVLATVAEKVGPVGSPHEAEYHALIRGLKLAAEKRLPYIAAFSDSANVVNQITGRMEQERASHRTLRRSRGSPQALQGMATFLGSPRDEQRRRQACRSSLQRRARNPRHRLMNVEHRRGHNEAGLETETPGRCHFCARRTSPPAVVLGTR